MHPFGQIPGNPEKPVKHHPHSPKTGETISRGTSEQVSAVLKPASILEKYKGRNPLNEDFVKLMQKEILESKKSAPSGTTFIIGQYFLYEFLLNKLSEAELKTELSELSLKKHQAFFLKMFEYFRTTLIGLDPTRITDPQLQELAKVLRKAPITDYQQMLDLIRKYPHVEQYGLFQYQDGLSENGQITSPFVHIKVDRLDPSIPKLSTHSVRIYLSPKLKAMPDLADQLLSFSTSSKIPLYFKMLDLSVNKPMKDAFTRLDRIIVYTDDKHLPKLLEFLEKYHQQNPDNFTDKNLPLCIKVKNGISLAPELTPEQKQKFPNDKSFNSYRAAMIGDICNITMQKMLLDPQISIVKPRSGRSIKAIFEDFLAENFQEYSFSKHLSKFSPEFKTILATIYQNNFTLTSPALNRYSHLIERALKQCFTDIIPNIHPDSMASAFQASYSLLHQKYLTDPKNISFNA